MPSFKSIRKRIYDIIDATNEEDNLSRGYDIFMIIVIAISMIPLMTKAQPTAMHIIDRVTVTGFVDDIRECYASARIFAAPMQTGSGLQNKLLEAMAMGLPCVTTSIANDSLQATLDTEILVGDTAQEFATHIINLLRNDEQRNELAANGTVFVHKNYSWETAGEKLEEVLRGVVMSGSSKVATEKYTRKGE